MVKNIRYLIFIILIFPLVSYAAQNNMSDADLIELPSGFQRMTGAQLDSSWISNITRKITPSFQTQAAWINVSLPGKPLAVLAKIEFRREDKNTPKNEMLNQLKQSAQTLQKNVESGAYCYGGVKGSASYDVKEQDSLLIETARINCVDNNIPQLALKYFYFFYPDYELQFYIEGRRSEIEPLIPALNASLESFLKKKLSSSNSSDSNPLNYYFRRICQVHANEDGSGYLYTLATVTRSLNGDRCNEFSKARSMPDGCVADCVVGTEDSENQSSFENLYGPMFKKEQAKMLYIYFRDRFDNESVLVFIEDPSVVSKELLEKSVAAFKADGAKEVRLVQPK